MLSGKFEFAGLLDADRSLATREIEMSAVYNTGQTVQNSVIKKIKLGCDALFS
jgi:hypothetical protein